MERPGVRNLRAAIKGLDGATGAVGWFESAKYEDGTPVAVIAAVHEYGAPSKGIPPRPFMRPTQQEKQQEWAGVARQVSRAVVAGKMPAGGLMEALALKAEGDVRAYIGKIQSPALKEATVEARKRRNAKGRKDGVGEASDKPLVDTGYMLATLTSKVTP